jgi:hypothetical protein
MVSGPAAPYRPPAPLHEKGTPAAQVLVVWANVMRRLKYYGAMVLLIWTSDMRGFGMKITRRLGNGSKRPSHLI